MDSTDTTATTATTATKIAVITGVSRGLGRSMALHLAAEGADVVGTYRTNEAEAADVARQIEALGRRAAMLPLDVGASDQFAAFATAVQDPLQREFGRATFDFLINNAGIGRYAPVADVTEAQFDELVAVHFKGPFFL